MRLHKKQAIFMLFALFFVFTAFSANAKDEVSEFFKVPNFKLITNKMGLPAQFPDGPTVALIDFDRDGWVDLKIGGQLWRNVNGEFVKWHLLPYSHHCFGDITNNGHLDVFCSTFKEYGDNVDFKWKLLLNDGTKLTDASAESGLTDLPATKAMAFLDFDRDGNLDLYVAGYETIFDSPNYEMLGDKLFKGDGTGKFVDVTESAGLSNQKSRNDKFNGRPACGVTITDINNDGYPDIYVANYRLEQNFLWLNQKDGTFRDIAETANVDLGYAHSNGVFWVDIDGDGDLDLFIANLAHSWVPQSRKSVLLRNDYIPTKTFKFTDVTEEYGLNWKPSKGCEDESTWINPVFADFNNDGLWDLFVTESAQGGTNHPKYDKKYGKNFDSGYSKFYMQFEARKFKRFDTDKNGLRIEDSWGCSAADIDNDGNVDLLVGSGTWNADPKIVTWFDPKNQKVALLKNFGIEFDKNNMSEDHQYININLFARDRALTGSIVQIIKTDAEKKIAVYDLGYSGYSNKSNQLHFGLGCDGVEEIIVKTPDGSVLKFEAPDDEPWFNVSLLIDCSKKNPEKPLKIRKLSPELSKIYSQIQRAESQFSEGEFFEAYYLFYLAENLIKNAPRKLTDEDKKALIEFRDNIRSKLAEIRDEVDKNEQRALKQLERPADSEARGNFFDAVKRLEAIIKSFNGTEVADFAEKRTEEILKNSEYGQEVADKLAGRAPITMLRNAERFLSRDETSKAEEILDEIIEKYPYTSFAAKARELLKSIKK